MPMTNVDEVHYLQERIDGIVNGFRPLFHRLIVVLNNDVIWNLMRREGFGLSSLELTMTRRYKVQRPVIPDESITKEVVAMKRVELSNLEVEVVEFFKRCETIVPHMTLYHLCMATGEVFGTNFNKLDIYEIYYSHLEEELWKPNCSSSDGCSTD